MTERTNPTLLMAVPQDVPVTVWEIAGRLAQAYHVTQAEFLLNFTERVEWWQRSGQETQFHAVARHLSDDDCARCAAMLDVLVEELRAVPGQREAARKADAVCAAVQEMLP